LDARAGKITLCERGGGRTAALGRATRLRVEAQHRPDVRREWVQQVLAIEAGAISLAEHVERCRSTGNRPDAALCRWLWIAASQRSSHVRRPRYQLQKKATVVRVLLRRRWRKEGDVLRTLRLAQLLAHRDLPRRAHLAQDLQQRPGCDSVSVQARSSSARLNLLFFLGESRVPVVLDRVVGPSGQQPRNLRPLRAACEQRSGWGVR